MWHSQLRFFNRTKQDASKNTTRTGIFNLARIICAYVALRKRNWNENLNQIKWFFFIWSQCKQWIFALKISEQDSSWKQNQSLYVSGFCLIFGFILCADSFQIGFSLSCNVKCLFYLKFTLDSDFAQIVLHLLHNCAIIVRTFWQNPNFIHRN